MRAIRGAITVAEDTPTDIAEATRELLAAIVARNGLTSEDLVSAIFTLTPDLRSEFPAVAAREMGWSEVALLCAVEVDVPGALPRCLRVLVHVETAHARAEVRHVYLRDAVALRPDLG
jgi:chorismate mutase